MKTSNYIRIGLLSMAVATLVGCGGGGSSGASTVAGNAFDSSQFQGTWKYNDGRVSGNPAGCIPYTEFNSHYGSLHRPSVLTATTITDTLEIYTDTTCSSYLGLLVKEYSVTWAAASLPGKTNVARVVVTSTGSAIRADGAPGFTLAGVPPRGVVSKEVFDVDGTLMYVSSPSAPKDADGYPTALHATALYTR